MDCKPLQTHDCLPTAKICTPLKAEAGKREDETMHVDVARMSVQTPFRNDTLPIASFEFNTESLVMQGTRRGGRLECNHSPYERKTDHRDSGSRGRIRHFWSVRAFRRQTAGDAAVELIWNTPMRSASGKR